MPRSAASDLGLHCLPVTHLGVASLQWVKSVLLARNLTLISWCISKRYNNTRRKKTESKEVICWWRWQQCCHHNKKTKNKEDGCIAGDQNARSTKRMISINRCIIWILKNLCNKEHTVCLAIAADLDLCSFLLKCLLTTRIAGRYSRTFALWKTLYTVIFRYKDSICFQRCCH